MSVLRNTFVILLTGCLLAVSCKKSSSGVNTYNPELNVSAVASVNKPEPVSEVHISVTPLEPVPIVDVSVLMEDYSWLERSDRVRELQEFVNVDVDGVYGSDTQVAHLNYLAMYELSNRHVPSARGSSERVRVNAPITPKCKEWWPVALQAGWAEADLTKLGHIIFKESTCQPDAVSPTKDYGLMQINWAAHGNRLSAAGITRRDLLDPLTNLIQAKVIADSALSWSGCKWQPWYMSGNWCR